MSKMPWFRTYTEMVDDEKLRLIAFEDRWHFVAILCLKGQGMLDSSDPLLARKVAVKLGIDLRSLEEVVRRLAEVGLIDGATMQPLAWDSRQMRSDVDATNAERQKRYRERKKGVDTEQAEEHNGDSNALHNAPVTPLEEDTDIEEDTEKEETALPAQAQAAHPGPEPVAAKRSTKSPAPPADVSLAVWSDFLKHRKAKRAPVTETVVRMLTIELQAAQLHGWTPDDAMAEAMAAGWQTVKAEWLVNRRSSSHGRPQGSQIPNRQEALEAKNRQVGEAWAARMQGGAQ